MSEWEIAWAVWGGTALATFGVMEYLAVRAGARSTLSATLRRWLGIDPRRRWAIAGSAVFVGVLGWFGAHVVFGVFP